MGSADATDGDARPRRYRGLYQTGDDHARSCSVVFVGSEHCAGSAPPSPWLASVWQSYAT